MPIQAQIPALAAITDTIGRGKTYLQTQVDADANFMLDGQLFLNRVDGKVFYKDSTNTVQDLKAINLDLLDTTLVNLHSTIVAANVPTITTVAEIVALLIDIQADLQNYVDNRET